MWLLWALWMFTGPRLLDTTIIQRLSGPRDVALRGGGDANSSVTSPGGRELSALIGPNSGASYTVYMADNTEATSFLSGISNPRKRSPVTHSARSLRFFVNSYCDVCDLLFSTVCIYRGVGIRLAVHLSVLRELVQNLQDPSIVRCALRIDVPCAVTASPAYHQLGK
jgi:hypothetical protein